MIVSDVLCSLLLSLHHTKLPSYMKEMKKYHLAHHYKNFDLGFGVTSEHHLLSSPWSTLTRPLQARFGISSSTRSYRCDLLVGKSFEDDTLYIFIISTSILYAYRVPFYTA